MTTTATLATLVDELIGENTPGDPAEIAGSLCKLVSDHPTVGNVSFSPTGKGGTLEAFAPGGTSAIFVATVRANGSVTHITPDAAKDRPGAPATTPHIISLLIATPGIGDRSARAALKETDVDPLTPFTAEQTKRSRSKAKPGLKAKARAVWIITGDDVKTQTEKGRKAREVAEAGKQSATRATRSGKDADAADVARRAKEIGTDAFKTPIGATQARKVIDLVAQNGKTVPELTGTTLKALRAFAVDAEKPTPELKARVREIAAETGDKLVWGRKLGLLLLAVHETPAKR